MTRTPLLPLVGADVQVPLVTGGTRRYANLDNAASTPCLQAVADRVAEVLPTYASVHRGAGYLSQLSTARYERSRDTVGRFVGARDDDVVVLVRNTTDALNLLAGVVPGRVVALDTEHHANLLPWKDVRRLGPGPTVTATLRQLAHTLDQEPAALVAVTGASNVTGEALPLADVVQIAQRAGARVALDAAQLAPHRRVSLSDSGVDYVAFSGHKLYAPFGTGALVGRRDWLDVGAPYLAGGGAVRDVGHDRTTWAAAPHRHEAGSPDVVGAAALAAACEQVAAATGGPLEAHEAALRTRLVAGLEQVPGVRVHRLWPDSAEPVGVVTFSLADSDPGLVAAYLSAEHGVGVRDGRFCAHLLLERLGAPGGALRASVGAGTSDEDVDRLVAALRWLVSHGTEAEYAIVDGRWAPLDDPRPLLGAPAAGCGSLVA